MSERDDLNEQVFHDPMHAREVVTSSAAAAAERVRAVEAPFEVGQPVLYLTPPAGGDPVQGRVVAIGAEACLVAGIDKTRNQHWIRHDHLAAVAAHE